MLTGGCSQLPKKPRRHSHLVANLLRAGEGLEGTGLRAVPANHEVLLHIPGQRRRNMVLADKGAS